MGKRGPKPSAGKREANGRKSRRPVDITTRLNSQLGAEEREMLRTGVEARHRLYKIAPRQLRDTDAGTAVGRLRLAGEITMQQCQAAILYCEVYEAMQVAISGPRPPGAVNLNATKGMPGAENEGKSIGARLAWEAALKAVQHRQNTLRLSASLIAALDYCVLRDGDHPHMLPWLKEALDALAQHFKIGDKHKDADKQPLTAMAKSA